MVLGRGKYLDSWGDGKSFGQLSQDIYGGCTHIPSPAKRDIAAPDLLCREHEWDRIGFCGWTSSLSGRRGFP
jgi:hypothetical protein